MIVLSDRGIVVLLWRLMKYVQNKRNYMCFKAAKITPKLRNLAFVASPYL